MMPSAPPSMAGPMPGPDPSMGGGAPPMGGDDLRGTLVQALAQIYQLAAEQGLNVDELVLEAKAQMGQPGASAPMGAPPPPPMVGGGGGGGAMPPPMMG